MTARLTVALTLIYVAAFVSFGGIAEALKALG